MRHDLDSLIARISPISDADAARPVSDPGDLARRIMATSPDDAPTVRPVRRRRIISIPLAIGLAGATAAVAVAVLTQPGGKTPGGSPPVIAPNFQPAAALSFTTKGKYIEVRIKDPLADPKRYQKEFAAHGMKIGLSLVPASPSIVGTLVMQDDGAGPDKRKIEPITAKGRCVSGGGGDICAVGLRIPVGYRNQAQIVFGRAARPGEQFSSTASAFAPGEALHCVAVRGLTVDAALAKIGKRHVTVPEFHVDEVQADGSVYGKNLGRDKIPGTWFVSKADPLAPGQVRLWVDAKPPKSSNGGYNALLNKGC
jgi:hypothetical protein